MRWPLEQTRIVHHDADDFCGCNGKACDRAAWAHSLLVSAAKGRDPAGASLLLDWATVHENVGHDHF